MNRIKKILKKDNTLTPKQIVTELDKYIIGQKEAKKNVAIALRNRWRRMHTPETIQNDIFPNNMLMVGPTGVGKTEIARRLAKIVKAPFIKVEATKFTEVGYVGRDVESMVRDLVERAIMMVKNEKKEEVKKEADRLIEEIILEILLPKLGSSGNSFSFPNQSQKENSNPKLTQQELDQKEQDYISTKEYYRKKIQNGELDDKEIEIDIMQKSSNNMNMIAGGVIDESSIINLQDMISNILPKKSKKKKVTIAEAKELLKDQTYDKLIDIDLVKTEALERSANNGIIFIDEMDKIAEKGGKEDQTFVSRAGVQRDLLPVVEGCSINTKHGVINTDHILFIAAGAFHVAQPSDLIPELQGRFPIRVDLESLSKKDFFSILKEPKNSLKKQYEALFQAEKVTIKFDDESLEEIADIAFEMNTEEENLGARRLHSIMTQLLNDFLFDVPDVITPSSNIEINQKVVKEKLENLKKNKDLKKYIL